MVYSSPQTSISSADSTVEVPHLPVIVAKLKAVRTILLSGSQRYKDEYYELPNACGVIELLGSRVGGMSTLLIVGFSNDLDLPPPTFHLHENEAVGTMTVRGANFAAIAFMANAGGTHFRIGGEGKMNAIGSDQLILN